VPSVPSLNDQFEGHFRSHAGAIRAYAVRAVGHAHADDIVSETFAIVWRRWLDAPANSDARRAWTYKIAHNIVSHHYRSESRRFRLLFRAVQTRPDVPTDPADVVTLDDWARRVVAELPPREREALGLVVFADLSPSEAASILGCSVTALSSRLTRARRRVADARAIHLDAERERADR
jgi:RNA polymerase sigma-70 factor (ECF subfamily)